MSIDQAEAFSFTGNARLGLLPILVGATFQGCEEAAEAEVRRLLFSPTPHQPPQWPSARGDAYRRLGACLVIGFLAAYGN